MKLKHFTLFLFIAFWGCKEDDQCDDVSCFNGGTCVDGLCDCPPGYSGPNCEDFDPCFDVDCLNGGVCLQGTCDCPPGYSGPFCEDFDPCFDVICENGGVCIDGDCDCPPNYIGDNCETQVTPLSIDIIGLQVTNFPVLNESGETWDEDGFPDLSVEIVKGADLIFTSPSVAQNAQPGGIYLWAPFFPSNMTSIEEEHEFRLFDDNSPDDMELIGTVTFIPYSSDNDFPSELEFMADSIAFKIMVEYNW